MTASTAATLGSRRGARAALHLRRRAAAHPGGALLAAADGLLTERYADEPGAVAVLDSARARALAAYAAAGADDAADRLSAALFCGDAVAVLAVEQLLRPRDVHDLAAELAVRTPEGTRPAVLLDLYLDAAANPLLASLPPLFAVETALRMLVLFGIAEDVSLWTRRNGRLECMLSLGDEEPSRRMRNAARVVLASGAALPPSRRSQIHALPVVRFGRVDAALVARVAPDTRDSAGVFLTEAAATLSPLVERGMLLDRSAARERELVTGTERRLTRLGFDLHDGPIQDVLALAADVRRFREEMHPFVVEPHQERAIADLEELQGRLVQLDRDLRELAQALESKSAISRPIEEVLHREVEAFAGRTGVDARIDVTGNAFLSASQRITLFRAVQEALSNVREHSGATRVEVSLHCRRSWTDLHIVDDGQGFRVEQGLASAAKRGRLGLIGMSERVRMLGGTFEIDSAPGGPTVLHVTLPRWEPLDPSSEQS